MLFAFGIFSMGLIPVLILRLRRTAAAGSGPVLPARQNYQYAHKKNRL
jgi:hypothetical protein